MAGRRIAGVVGAATVAVFGLVAAPSPAAAECPGLGAWPSFREIAPSAERIIVGQVVRNADPELLQTGLPRYRLVRGKVVEERTASGLGGWIRVFELRVDLVLRGDDREGESIVISNLEPGVPLTYCPRDDELYVMQGDVIAIAFNGRDLHGRLGVNAAAWIRRADDHGNLRRDAEHVTVRDLRRLVGLLPADSAASVTRPSSSPWRA